MEDRVWPVGAIINTIMTQFFIYQQENCFKNNIKIYIKTVPTCFFATTIIRQRVIWAC